MALPLRFSSISIYPYLNVYIYSLLQNRTRTITVNPVNTSVPCPALSEAVYCPLPCTSPKFSFPFLPYPTYFTGPSPPSSPTLEPSPSFEPSPTTPTPTLSSNPPSPAPASSNPNPSYTPTGFTSTPSVPLPTPTPVPEPTPTPEPSRSLYIFPAPTPADGISSPSNVNWPLIGGIIGAIVLIIIIVIIVVLVLKFRKKDDGMIFLQPRPNTADD